MKSKQTKKAASKRKASVRMAYHGNVSKQLRGNGIISIFSKQYALAAGEN